MKKCTIMVVVTCLLSLEAPLHAGKKEIAAWVLGTAHLTGGGVYYYNKNQKEKGFAQTNVYKGYVGGALLGAMPIGNIGFGLGIITTKTIDWFNEASMISTRDKAFYKGFLAAISSYVTVPTAYMFLRALKKVK